MKKLNIICIIISLSFLVLSIVESFLSSNIFSVSTLYSYKSNLELLDKIFRLLFFVLSSFLIVLVCIYRKQYKDQYGVIPNGYSLMLLGSIFILIGIGGIGMFINFAGALIAIYETIKNYRKEQEL